MVAIKHEGGGVTTIPPVGKSNNYLFLRKAQLAEEKVFDASLKFVEVDKTTSDLMKNLNLGLEILNIIMDSYRPKSELEAVIKDGILPRLLNSSVVSLRVLLIGYYQVSFALQRDLIEIKFLADYFTTYPSKILEWKNSTDKQRKRLFSMRELYTALDKRDGYKNEQRKKSYQRFSEYATHLNYKGAVMLTKGDTILAGPFYDENKLGNALFELTMQFGHAFVLSTSNLRITDKKLLVSQLGFMSQYGKVFNLKEPRIIVPKNRVALP